MDEELNSFLALCQEFCSEDRIFTDREQFIVKVEVEKEFSKILLDQAEEIEWEGFIVNRLEDSELDLIIFRKNELTY